MAWSPLLIASPSAVNPGRPDHIYGEASGAAHVVNDDDDRPRTEIDNE